MSDPANSRSEAAEERISALLVAAARAAHRSGTGFTLAELVEPERYRLSEIERVAIRRMFVGLVGGIEDEMRARLLTEPELPDKPEFAASLGAAHVAIAWPILARAGFLEDDELANILERRGKSYHIIRQLRRTGVTDENGRLDVLTQHGDRDIAAHAMKLLIAESRINERFDDPRLGRSDLPETVDHRLVWTVAAALRDYGAHVHRMDGVALDRVVTNVARRMLEDRGDEPPVDAVAMRLAEKLYDAGLIDDPLLVEALNGARPIFYAAMLAVRAGISFEIAWDMATMPDVPSHMVLLKSIGVERDVASQSLMAMLHAVLAENGKADEVAAEWVELYDTLRPEDTEAAMRPWRLDPVYRSVVAQLAAADSGALR
ncbi:DUF2336 domain-containing protein [Parasphingopyxis algicola]|uniref:DUF2336 domain-containing protein n=1 Tax=Parasphingopyxis algicola TaxID=2026624 RepID=UPI0015A37F9C|nr:DUF2336 domain-containing protein [Parasphingopyxis algicola]QLC24366.1 DUF2336 domain-containing protein [Parasphingopyxis algicola]